MTKPLARWAPEPEADELEPEVLRFLEALARAHVDEDYARQQGAAERADG